MTSLFDETDFLPSTYKFRLVYALVLRIFQIVCKKRFCQKQTSYYNNLFLKKGLVTVNENYQILSIVAEANGHV